MSEMAPTPESKSNGDEATPAPTPPPPRRGPGHRGQDMRDTVAEMAARAHEISLEAGSKMASAMRDVIGAAAGMTSFAVESARDLVQYMVRRGQMTQEEADKLIKEAEEASGKRAKAAPEAPKKPVVSTAPAAVATPPAPKPVLVKNSEPVPAKKVNFVPPPKAAAPKPAAKAAAKPAAKAAAKPAAKAAAKKPAPKKPALKKR